MKDRKLSDSVELEDIVMLFNKVEEDYKNGEIDDFYLKVSIILIGFMIEGYDTSNKDDEAIDFLKLVIRYTEFSKEVEDEI